MPRLFKRPRKYLAQGGLFWLIAIFIVLPILTILIQTEPVRATTSGQMKLYMHKEPSDVNATYNALSWTPPEPGAYSATSSSSTITNGNPPTALCEASTNAGETFNEIVAAANATGDRCMASFISPPVGQSISISTADTSALAANIWSSESTTIVTAPNILNLYQYSGGTLTQFGSFSISGSGTSPTNLVATATPVASVTLAATDRIAIIWAMNVTHSHSGATTAVYFDNTAQSAPSNITINYSATTPNRPALTGSMDDDFTTAKATTACSTSGVVFTGNTSWTCLDGTASGSTGAFNDEDSVPTASAGDTSSWLWLQNQFTSTGTPSNFGSTPSNTYLYQTLPSGYGDGNVQTVVNSTLAYTIGSTNPASPYSHTSLALWVSNTDYLEVQVYSTGDKSAATNTTDVALNDSGTISGATSLNSTTASGLYGRVWLGFKNTAGSYQAQYSTDGTTWINVGSAVIHTAYSRVGLNSYTGVGSVISAYAGAFEWFSYGFAAPPVTGPTTDQEMRHGKWWNAGAEQSFYWAK